MAQDNSSAWRCLAFQATAGDRLVAASQLNKALGSVLVFAQATAGPTPQEPVDKIYEASLRSALQVITAP